MKEKPLTQVKRQLWFTISAGKQINYVNIYENIYKHIFLIIIIIIEYI